LVALQAPALGSGVVAVNENSQQLLLTVASLVEGWAAVD
jgi:hypothetical protein